MSDNHRSRSRSRSPRRSPSPERRGMASSALSRRRDIWKEREKRARFLGNPIYFKIVYLNSAINGLFRTYEIEELGSKMQVDLVKYLSFLESNLYDELESQFHHYAGINWIVIVNVIYRKASNISIEKQVSLTSSRQSIFTKNDLRETLQAAMGQLIEQSDNLQEGASDWVIKEISPIHLLKVDTSLYSRGIQGGGHVAARLRPGRKYIEAPQWIKDKQCCINIKNKDNKCFKYALECAWRFKHQKEETDITKKIVSNPQRMVHYQGLENFKYGDLEFPIHVSDIEKFERLNQDKCVALHVYFVGPKPGVIEVAYSSKNRTKDAWHVHLLVWNEIHEETGTQETAHYAFITRLSALLRNKYKKGNTHTMYVCDRCTQQFASQGSLDEHTELCVSLESSVPLLPDKNKSFTYFSAMKKINRKPCVIYCDFESFNQPVKHESNESITAMNRKSKQIASAFGMYTSWYKHEKQNNYQDYTTTQADYDEAGETEVGKRFIKAILEEGRRCKDIINSHYSHKASFLSPEQLVHYEAQTECCICELSLKDGMMPHWLYENHRKKDDFNDEDAYLMHQLASHQANPPEMVTRSILRDNLTKCQAWDPMKIRDNYIGACHKICKASIGEYGDIPVVFHNLTNYDEHLIIHSLDNSAFAGGKNTDWRKQFTGIPQPGDKFMMFKFEGLMFLDSYKFMADSLDTLSANLAKGGADSFKHFNPTMKAMMKDHFPDCKYDDTIRDRIMKKGILPYEWLDCPAKLLATDLPKLTDEYVELIEDPNTRDITPTKRSMWYSHLTDKTISDKEYNEVISLYKDTGCRNVGHFQQLYLMQDVLILADVFDTFREQCHNGYGLEPLWYFSIPGFTYDSCFKILNKKQNPQYIGKLPFCIQSFSKGEEDMFEFIEQTIRGGVSMTPGRYAKASNQFIKGGEADPNPSHVLYYDANNLYGWAMSQYLPTGDYGWYNPRGDTAEDRVKWMIDDINIMGPTANRGAIYEIDCEFPPECHDYLSDFPPAPEHRTVPFSITSPYYRNLLKRYKQKHDERTGKLICSFLPHKKYKVHYRTLKLYIDLGMKVTEVYRCLTFAQSDWLGPYIKHNTDKRALATTDFEKNLYKLLNNSCYGKFIQNNRKFQKIKAILDPDDKERWDPMMKEWRRVNKDLVIASVKKGRTELSQPIIVGAVVLEHAKFLMYDFYYNKLKRMYGLNLRLILTDTDSLVVQIHTKNPMDDFKEAGMLNDFDLAAWPKDDSYYGANWHDKKNNKEIGKFKDEMVESKINKIIKPRYIKEVVALRSKMYSIEFEDEIVNKAIAKGVSRSVIAKLTHEKYYHCMMDAENIMPEKALMSNIRSSNNELWVTLFEKVTLSPTDSKVYMQDHVNTLPYGHKDILESESSL